jgi:hypothetical protein
MTLIGGAKREPARSGGIRNVWQAGFAPQIVHVLHDGLAAFDLNDDLLRLSGLGVVTERDFGVNAVVCALLLLDGPGAHEAKRPPLKLKLVLFGENEPSFGVVGSPMVLISIWSL